jgi:hypothetical protein
MLRASGCSRLELAAWSVVDAAVSFRGPHPQGALPVVNTNHPDAVPGLHVDKQFLRAVGRRPTGS